MVVRVDKVDYNKINFTPEKQRRGEKKRQGTVAAQVCAFDIEATRFEAVEQSAMYVWQFSVNNEIVIVGRTWKEYLNMLNRLKERLNGLRLIIYVHNLSYEFQFLAGVYEFDNREVFATDSRKVLKCTMYDTFEYRCSYRLFNMSLDAVTRKYKCTYTKRSGIAFDYDKKRTSKTKLTRKELLYCVYDVLGLVEAVKAQMALYDDNLYTIPYTQTGYVRREAKREMRKEVHEVLRCYPDFELYQVMRAAFRGGNTHANRFYVGEILNNVHGNDVSSEYPAQQVLEQYPRTPFEEIGSASLNTAYIDKLIHRNRALLMIVEFTDIELRRWYDGFPYLPTAKAIGKPTSVEADNGRVLRAHKLRIALTDLDYKIVMRQYAARHTEIIKAWSARYGPMYDGIVRLNKELFIKKTTLKGVDGQELYYLKAKEQLNSIYGMSCQNPLNTEILFSNFLYKEKIQDPEEVLEASRKRAFLPYQMGVWTTAHARTELQHFIDRAGENAVYCDTDSLMFVGDVSFDDYNTDYKAKCEKIGYGAYADDPKGKRHYLGVFESEDGPSGFKFDRFVTLGAKRYAYENHKGLGITVSGVSKKSGAKELARKGGLEAFKPGLVWNDTGKLEAIYNDEQLDADFVFNGERLKFTPNVTLRPASYTIKLSEDYADLLERCSARDIEGAIRDFENLERVSSMNKNYH